MKKIALIISVLFTAYFANAQAEHAGDIMSDAYKQAGKENKEVFLIFHASWCGWCHKMDSSMNDALCKDFFDRNYVTVHITVEENEKHKADENPGGKELKTKLLGDKAGLPFWVILDKNGKVIADSYIRKPGVKDNEPGDNIGCPAENEEVNAFIKALKLSSDIGLADEEKIRDRFKKNKSASH